MTTISPRPAAARAWLTDAYRGLSDLTPPERDGLSEQIAEHVDAVIEENDLVEPTRAVLVARLGTPSDYVRQLREAAGLHEARPQTLGPWLLALPGMPAVWAYLRSLEPAWWAARGFLIAGIPIMLQRTSDSYGGAYVFGRWNLDVYTENDQASVLWVLLIVAVIVASIVIGIRSRHAGLGLRLVHRLADVFGVVALLTLPMWWIGPAFYSYVVNRSNY